MKQYVFFIGFMLLLVGFITFLTLKSRATHAAYADHTAHATATTAQQAWVGPCTSLSVAEAQLKNMSACGMGPKDRLDTVYFKICKGERVPGITGALIYDYVFPAMACTSKVVPTSHQAVSSIRYWQSIAVIELIFAGFLVWVIYLKPANKFAKFEQE